jgi:uncharacterized oxidoreductase
MILRDRTIMITGGTSGIGLALALELNRAGNSVIVCGRDPDRLAAVRDQAPDIVTRRCDLASTEQREELAEWLVKEYPAVDTLINNAAVQYRFDVTQPIDMVRTRHQIEVNLVAPLQLSSLLAAHLATRPAAAIVNMTSALAFLPLVEIGLYSATKAATHSLTISMRYQLKGLGIQVIEVLPPKVDTTIGAELRADPTQTQGGMPVPELVAQALAGLESGSEEILIGLAVRAKTDPEAVFWMLND